MTILGVHVMLGERAIIWADTEMMWHNGASAGHCNKLLVNAAAGLACASAGWMEVATAAKAVACSAPTFDAALDTMPDALRIVAARYVRRGGIGSDPREFGDQVTILTGWSERYGCTTAFEFAGYAYFAPVIVSQATHPSVPDIAPPHSAFDVLRTALAQARELRLSFPNLGCGRLTMAVVTRDQVTTAAPFDLGNDIQDDACCFAEGGGSIRQHRSTVAPGAAARWNATRRAAGAHSDTAGSMWE